MGLQELDTTELLSLSKSIYSSYKEIFLRNCDFCNMYNGVVGTADTPGVY